MEWTKLVWFTGRIPRQSFITWLALRSALKTRAKLHSWEVIDSPLCIFCSTEPETEAHLFGACNFGKSIWNGLLQKLGFNRVGLHWEAEICWCIEHFRGGGSISVIQKLVFCSFVYHMWAERNRRVHGAQFMQVGQVLKLLLMDIKLRVVSMDVKVPDSNLNRKFMARWNMDAVFESSIVTECSWVGPSSGWFMLNTDGSLSNNGAGTGVVVRDEHGTVVVVGAGNFVPSTITIHELQAVEAGLIMARDQALHRVSIASDSTTVVHLLKHRDQRGPWHVLQLLRRIETLRRQFERTTIQHVYQETNRAADHLSKLLPSAEFVEVVESSFAEGFKKILYEDKIGTVYLRL